MSKIPEWFEITANDSNPEPTKSKFSKTLATVLAVPLSLAILVGGAYVFAEGDDDDHPGNLPTLSNQTVTSSNNSLNSKTSVASKKSSSKATGDSTLQINTNSSPNTNQVSINKPIGNFADPNSVKASKSGDDDDFEGDDHESGEHEGRNHHESGEHEDEEEDH